MKIFQTIKNWIAPSQAQETREEIPSAIARVPRELGVPREVARVPTKVEVISGGVRQSQNVAQQPVQTAAIPSGSTQTPTGRELAPEEKDFF